MKRSICLLAVVLLASILSGCIISSTPKNNEVNVLITASQSFSIKVFPTGTQYVWTLDGNAISNTTNTYIYTPKDDGLSEHVLKVEASHLFGKDTREWKIVDALASQTVGPDGGTITLDNSDYFANGFEIQIPEGALTKKTVITLAELSSCPVYKDNEVGLNFPIKLLPEGQIFSKPVRIKMPFSENAMTESGNIDLTYANLMSFNESTQTWENNPILSVDYTNHIIEAEITHFSKWRIWVPWAKKDELDVIDQEVHYIQNVWGLAGTTDEIKQALVGGEGLLDGIPFKNGIGAILIAGDLSYKLVNKDIKGACSTLAKWGIEKGISAAGLPLLSGITSMGFMTYSYFDYLVTSLDDGAFVAQTNYYVTWIKDMGYTEQDLLVDDECGITIDGWLFNPHCMMQSLCGIRPVLKDKYTIEQVFAVGRVNLAIQNNISNKAYEEDQLKELFIQELNDVKNRNNPVAQITLQSASSGLVPFSVSLDASSSYAKSGTISKYEWDMGDGTGNSEGAIAQYTYNRPGNYIITLKVTDSEGREGSTTVKVFSTVANPNNVAPVASFTYTIAQDNTVTFDATSSTDSDGSIIKYAWQFGEGNTAKGMTVSFQYSTEGVYPVTLEVVDNDFGTTKITKNIIIGPYNPPVVEAGSDQLVSVGSSVTLEGSGSSDPDNNIVSYQWWQLSGPAVGLNNGSSATAQFIANVPADSVLAFALIVTDAEGLVSTDTCTIRVISGKPPVKTFGKLFNRGSHDFIRSVEQDMDGGYVLAGNTMTGGEEYYDVWLLKFDINGNKLWDRTFGWKRNEYATTVQQTLDGGYILAGGSSKDPYGGGEGDFLLIKTDHNGLEWWHKLYGDEGYDQGNSVQQTSSGGYILAGWTSYCNNLGCYYGRLINTDANGNILWDKFYGSGGDLFYSVQQTSDGGYVAAGTTASHGDINSEFWLVKTDSGGNVVWEKTYGGIGEVAYSVEQTNDGGYIMAGVAQYPNGSNGNRLIKIDPSGNMQWSQMLYSPGIGSSACSVKQTSDGGYAVAGSGTAAWSYSWLIKTDTYGNVMWDKFYWECIIKNVARSMKLTSDGGYVLAGYTEDDYKGFIIKTDENGNTPESPN